MVSNEQKNGNITRSNKLREEAQKKLESLSEAIKEVINLTEAEANMLTATTTDIKNLVEKVKEVHLLLKEFALKGFRHRRHLKKVNSAVIYEFKSSFFNIYHIW